MREIELRESQGRQRDGRDWGAGEVDGDVMVGGFIDGLDQSLGERFEGGVGRGGQNPNAESFGHRVGQNETDAGEKDGGGNIAKGTTSLIPTLP